MKNGKRGGPGGILAELMEYASRSIYTNHLRSRRISRERKSADIILIHKKGKKENIRNYRPINRLSVYIYSQNHYQQNTQHIGLCISKRTGWIQKQIEYNCGFTIKGNYESN